MAGLPEIYMEVHPTQNTEEQLKKAIHHVKDQNLKQAFQSKLQGASDENILRAARELRQHQAQLSQFFQR